MSYRNLIDAENFFETASKEELIDFLIKKINNEVEKGDGADCDLIRECSDWLDELTANEAVFTPEELERNLEKIKANILSDKPVKKRKKFSTKTFVRVAIVAAVFFTISIVSLSVIASNKGYSSALEYITDNIDKIFGLNDCDTIKEKGINVIKSAESIRYENIDEFINNEALNILYPHTLPENIDILKVHYIQKSPDTYTLCFSFSNPKYIFNISTYYITNITAEEVDKCITIENLNFYYAQLEGNIHYAILQHEGYEYTIQTPTYNDLLIIMNSMKG